MYDLLIKNGRIVTPELIQEGSVAVKDGKISLSMKALEAGAPEEEREETSFPKDYKLPKAEELGTSLGSLLKNIKL